MVSALALLLAGLGLLAGCGGTTTGKGETMVDGGSVAAPGAGTAGSARGAPAASLRGGDLVGWTAGELHGRLGQPTMTFVEYPAEVWRYSAPSCVVLVFLYPQDTGPGGLPVVRHVEILPRQGRAADVLGCLQEIDDIGTV